jgi:hypothetical protein
MGDDMLRDPRLCLSMVVSISMGLFTPVASADVDNFARRIGEGTLNRDHRALGVPDTDAQTHIWASATYANSQSPGPLSFGSEFHADLGQMVIGADRRWGDWFAGVALSYAERATNTSYADEFSRFNLDSTSHEPAIAGYLGYRLSDQLFLNGLIGFEHQRTKLRDLDFTYETPFSDLSINATGQWGAWVARGRLGHRFEYLIIDSNALFVSEDRYKNVVYCLGEVGYQFGSWQPYFRTRIEEYISGAGGDQQLAFVGLGVSYHAGEAVDLGVVYERELKDDFVEYNQALVTAALRF